MNAFILAAGLGTRLRPLTNFYAKPCIPFLNVPMGYYAFRYLNQLKINTLAANSFHLPQQIEDLYKKNPYWSGLTHISHDGNFILGSAGGLKKAASGFSRAETTLMINSDEVFFCNEPDFLLKAQLQHEKNNNLATLLVMAHPEAGKKFGAIWCNSERKPQHIGKHCSDASLTPWHYIGYIFLHPEVLDLIPANRESNILYDVLLHHLPRVETFSISCRWYETGNGADYLLATEDCLERIDATTLDFINQYDKSRLVKNTEGISLLSNAAQVDEKTLCGYNVISGRSDPQILKGQPKISGSVFFDQLQLNAGYFS